MREAQLDAEVRKIAQHYGVHAHHKRNSVDEAPGFPDWVLVGQGGVLWRENKTETGTLSTEQRMMSMVLRALDLDWAVWRPRDVRSGRIRREIAAVAAVR
jgi:hypothetical protein